MTRDEIARDLDKLATVLDMATAAIERLADQIRQEEPQAPAPPASAGPAPTEA